MSKENKFNRYFNTGQEVSLSYSIANDTPQTIAHQHEPVSTAKQDNRCAIPPVLYPTPSESSLSPLPTTPRLQLAIPHPHRPDSNTSLQGYPHDTYEKMEFVQAEYADKQVEKILADKSKNALINAKLTELKYRKPEVLTFRPDLNYALDLNYIPPLLVNTAQALHTQSRLPVDGIILSLLTTVSIASHGCFKTSVTNMWTEPNITYAILVAPYGSKENLLIDYLRQPFEKFTYNYSKELDRLALEETEKLAIKLNRRQMNSLLSELFGNELSVEESMADLEALGKQTANLKRSFKQKKYPPPHFY